MKRVGLISLVGGLLAGIFVAFAPNVDHWGKRHEPHEKNQQFLLQSGKQIGQTFAMKEKALTGIAVWVDTKQPFPKVGKFLLEVEVGSEKIGAQVDVQNILSSGIVIFRFAEPLVSKKGTQGKYMLGLSEKDQSIALQFQIDSTKYEDGEVVHYSTAKKGDLAFQLLYKRPALGSRLLHVGYGVLLFVCGLVMWWTLQIYPGQKIRVLKQDILVTLSVGIIVTLFYGALLFRSGYWVGPTDFTKDAAYLGAGAQALKAFSWPIWMHTICGGLPLLGSIEGNTMSIGTFFAFFFDPQHALMLMNILEAGIAAAGAYTLARLFSTTRLGAVAAAVIYSLSPVYVFKLSIGYSMIGGVFAFAPWVLLFFIAGVMKARTLYAASAGLLLGFIVLRGEAHIIVVLAILLFVWALYDTTQKKRVRAWVLLLVCFAMAFFVSSTKILPYIEHVSEEPIKLFPYVAPLLQRNLLFETLFTVRADHETVPVLHGKFGEEWGVFGSYVGYLPIILACIGLFAKRRYGLGIWLLLLVAFLLSEGTLYEYVLRFIYPLDALLRMPVRNMLLVVLLLAILAARGLDFIVSFVKISYIKYFLYICLIVFLCVDLGRATHSVVVNSMNHFDQMSSPNAASPMFANYEVRNDSQKNANILLARGFLLPQVCADQNRTVSFIKNLKPDSSFASVPAQLSSNMVILAVPPGVRDMTVNERFDTMWTSRQAYILEHTDGSIHVIPHEKNVTTIVLEQNSPTKRAQQVILLTVCMYIATLLICRKNWL